MKGGHRKKDHPRGREKHAFFSEAEESSGNKLVFELTVSTKGQCRRA